MTDKNLLFSDRLKLTKTFEKWADDNRVAKTPMSMVTFLSVHGLLNTNKLDTYFEEYENIYGKILSSGGFKI